jgi:hypothetical protein
VPKVHRVKRTRGGKKEYRCVKCGKPIEPGQEYYHWTKYKQPVRQQHVSCGYPKRSQLSNSKMGPVWDAVDDAIAELQKGQTLEDFKSTLESVAQTAHDVASEYEESADNIEQQFSSSATADACRNAAEQLESWAEDLENWEPSVDTDEGTKPVDEWLDQVREEAIEKLGEQPEYEG